MSKFCSECFNCIIDFFYRIKYQLKKFWKERQRKKEFFSANLFNNEEEQPAKILSSEEIGNMINDQIKFNEEHPNISEYKIVKETSDDTNINVNDIKKEIGQVEFDDDDDEEEKKVKHKDDSSEEEEKEDIEDLKKTILNNPDV
jgi:hypothetical protein